MATAVGWLLGSLLLPYLSNFAAGAGAGIMQWPVLYHRLPRAWRWPVVTAAAWLGGSFLLLLAVPADRQVLLAGMILGPLVGLAQWLILRHEVHWAGWWIAMSTIAWITGLTLLPGLLSTGATSGAITGLALGLLFHYPKPVPDGNGPTTISSSDQTGGS